jgi:hypothetical protein
MSWIEHKSSKLTYLTFYVGVNQIGNVIGLNDDLKSFDDSFDKFTSVQKNIEEENP